MKAFRKSPLHNQALVWLIALACLFSFSGGRTVLCRNHVGELKVETTTSGDHCCERHLPECHRHSQASGETQLMSAALSPVHHHNFCDDRELSLQLHAPRRLDQKLTVSQTVAVANGLTAFNSNQHHRQINSPQPPPGSPIHPHISTTILLI